MQDIIQNQFLPPGLGKDRVVISLVSRQTIPNYIGAKILEPKTIIYLYTEQEKHALENLENVLKTKAEKYLIDAYDPDGIQQILLTIIKNHLSSEILLNLTGGTKIMAFAAFDVFRKHGKKSFYVNTANNEILWFMNDQILRTSFRDIIDIPTYFKLYGQNIFAEDYPKYPEISFQIGENYKAFKNLLSEFRKIELGKTFRINMPLSPRQKELLSQIANLGLVQYNKKHYSITVKDSEVLKYLKGDWLEEYSYLLIKKTGWTDVRFRVRLKMQDREDRWKNEFDIVAINKNKLYIFECKSGKLNQNDIHKLESLRELVGGTFGRGYLIYSSMNENENINERLKDFKEIKIIQVSDLQTVLQYL